MLYVRYLKDSLLSSFKTSPITLLIGPRRSGKTYLMQEIAKELRLDYITFDTLKQLVAAQDDPEGFIDSIKKPVIIDEVQRVPEIALPIKLKVDQEKKAGFFGLTGSANPLVAPKLNDSLAGRMFINYLWPLSISEINNTKSHFLELVFNQEAVFPNGKSFDKKNMVEIFSLGGYPDALALDDITRDRWYDNLLTTILERDVKDISSLTRPKDIAKLLNILAYRASNLLNTSELSRIASIPYTTLNNYMYILESLFLVIRQAAWHNNKTKRLLKMPKIYFCDTGLLINQLRIDKNIILENGKMLGLILENFVFLELKKLTSWSLNKIDLFHYHTQTGIEVDIILENRKGEIVAIEVKSSESINLDDWRGINYLEKEIGNKMIRGIILYPGKDVVHFKKNRLALPLSTLWDS